MMAKCPFLRIEIDTVFPSTRPGLHGLFPTPSASPPARRKQSRIQAHTRQKIRLQPREARRECDIFVVNYEVSGRFLTIVPLSRAGHPMAPEFISSQSLASMSMSYSGKLDSAFPRDKCDIRGAWDLR
jgi:hypothetical protein